MLSTVIAMRLTREAFTAFGVDTVAYVRPIPSTNGSCGIYAADGRILATASDHEAARAIIRRNELEPAYLQ